MARRIIVALEWEVNLVCMVLSEIASLTANEISVGQGVNVNSDQCMAPSP